MAFESLTEKLSATFKRLRGKGRLSEADVKQAMKEIKMALLEADVNFKVVKNFVATVSERAVGADVMESLTPAQMIVKIVNEELTALMGSGDSKLAIASTPPTVVMLVGLQGAGKTTTSGKLAGLLKKQGNLISQYSFLPGLAEAKVLAQFITNAGLSWFDPTTYESTFDTPEVQEVVRYYYDILGKNEVNDVGSTFYPLFAQGKIAMVMGGLYCIDAYDLDHLDLGVAYPPVKDENTECKPYTTGCVGFAVSSRSKVKDEAFKFIEWYLDYYGEQDAKNCNNFPALKKYAEEYMLDPEINTNPVKFKATQLFYGSLSKAVVIDRNPYCSQASFENIEFTYTGEYLEGALSFEDFCNTLDYEINKRVNQAKG